MSVAFRRDSDEEHKEPRFELPLPAGPNLVTPRGLVQIRERVDALEAGADKAGDASEIESAKRELRYWRTRLATAQLAPIPADGEAGIGSRVRFLLNGEERSIDIVGGDEANPAAGLLAFTAPLARALMGAAAQDYVHFGGREDAIEVLEVGKIDN